MKVRFSFVRVALLVPVGGILWWAMFWHVDVGVFHSMWTSSLVATIVDCGMISIRSKSPVLKLDRSKVVFALVETFVAALVFAILMGIYTFMALPPPDA